MEFEQVPEGWVEFESWGVDIADEQGRWEGVNIAHSEGSALRYSREKQIGNTGLEPAFEELLSLAFRSGVANQ